MQQRSGNPILVIGKAARLLEQFRDRDTLSLADMSDRLKMSKSTVHRLLSSLEQVGFVEREPQPGSYRLGIKLFQLGSLVQARMHLRQIALHYMTKLVEETDETAFLIIRDGLQGLCIERVEGRNVQSLELKLGGTLPLTVGAGPRVLLAYSPPEVLEQVLGSDSLPLFTPDSLANADAVRADVAQVRSQGYALSYEDVTIGVAALGVPIFDYKGEVIAALSLSGITPRWTEAHRAEMLKDLQPVAAQISMRMGWRPEATGEDDVTVSRVLSVSQVDG